MTAACYVARNEVLKGTIRFGHVIDGGGSYILWLWNYIEVLTHPIKLGGVPGTKEGFGFIALHFKYGTDKLFGNRKWC
jgi:hypothetical protein